MSDNPAQVHAPFRLPERPKASRVRRRDARALLTPPPERTQNLLGFDDEFTDIVDYIYRITHRIWVERALGRIRDYYAPNCWVKTPYGVTHSVEDVIASTAAMLTSFPDRESHFLNVAWSQDADGFYTSHLGFSWMTNRGPSLYGPATNRRVLIRTVADCVSADNQIHTEWLVRDNGALVRQLGFDRHQVAQGLAERLPDHLEPDPPRTRAASTGDSPEGFARDLFDAVWNARRLDRLEQAYAPDVAVHSGGGRVAVGTWALGAIVFTLLASIPDAMMNIDHVCWSEETDGVILAVRWRLEGTTRSGGLLGEVPSGQAVSMTGISHLRFRRGVIVEEWTLFDEVAVLTQAYRAAAPVEV